MLLANDKTEWDSNNDTIQGTVELNPAGGTTQTVRLLNDRVINPSATAGQSALFMTGGGTSNAYISGTLLQSSAAGTFAINMAAGAGHLFDLGGNTFTGTITIAGTMLTAVAQTGSVTPGHVATFNASGVIQDGGTSNTAVQSNVLTQLGADVALTVNPITSILTEAVVMPSSGCPCRVLVSYGVYETSGNATFDAWVADSSGTPNIIAQTQAAITNTNVGGFSGSQVSPNTYANSANITFTLDVTNSVAGSVIKSAASANPASGTPQKTWMSITVLTTN